MDVAALYCTLKESHISISVSFINATSRHYLLGVCRLYVPTMLVIGLHGWVLPPGAILVCDLFVYSEFLIHPVLLLAASRRMRREIGRGLKTTVLVSASKSSIRILSGGL